MTTKLLPKVFFWTYLIPDPQLFEPRNTGIANQMTTVFAAESLNHLPLFG